MTHPRWSASTLIVARDPYGFRVRAPAAHLDTYVPESYAQCVEGEHTLCPLHWAKPVPRRGRCDCACHAWTPPV